MTVSFDGVRIDAAEVLTNWTNWGATATQEPDYKYQGDYCISCQVKTAEVGQYLTDPTTRNYTNPKVVLFKVIQTNYTAIDGNGLQLYIGSDVTNHWRYEIFSALSYPALGGFQIVPIDPTIHGYRTQAIGNPDVTAIDFYGIKSDANAQAKAPNLGIDAVDYLLYGQGLTMTGSNQNFDDFVDYDEGVLTNRYGVVSTKEGIIYVVGILNIGTATLTTFSDSNKTLVFPDGRFGVGFCGINIGLQNSSNDITFTSCTLIGRGTEPSAARFRDTRPVFTVEGQNGSLLIDACSIQNFNYFYFNSKVTLEDSSIVNPELMVMSGATIQRNTFESPTVSAYQPFLLCDDLEKVTYTDFISNGFGHAIELTVSGDGTLNFTGNTFSNYASANGNTGNEAIYNNSGGWITVFLIDTSSVPSIRNGIGSQTDVQLSVSLTLTGIVSGSEVRIQEARGANPSGAELYHVESTPSGGSVIWAYNFSDFPAGQKIDIIVHNIYYTHLRIDDFDLPSSNTSLPIQQIEDRWYSNP